MYQNQEAPKGDMLKDNILPTKNPKGTWLHPPVFAVLIQWQEKMQFLKKLGLNHSEICEPTPVFPAPPWKQQAANAAHRKSVHPALLYLSLANRNLRIPHQLFPADLR